MVEPGSNLDFYCPVTGIEDPKVAWFKRRPGSDLVLVKPGRDCILSNTTLDGVFTAVLSLRNINAEKYAMYVCRTNNRAGEDQAHITLAGELVHLSSS